MKAKTAPIIYGIFLSITIFLATSVSAGAFGSTFLYSSHQSFLWGQTGQNHTVYIRMPPGSSGSIETSCVNGVCTVTTSPRQSERSRVMSKQIDNRIKEMIKKINAQISQQQIRVRQSTIINF